jgi:hypothetical protein
MWPALDDTVPVFRAMAVSLFLCFLDFFVIMSSNSKPER